MIQADPKVIAEARSKAAAQLASFDRLVLGSTATVVCVRTGPDYADIQATSDSGSTATTRVVLLAD